MTQTGAALPDPAHPLNPATARQHLLEHGRLPESGLLPVVARSWERSLAAGLAPGQALRNEAHSSASALRQTLQHNHSLLAHARPVMEFLAEQLRHSQSVVVLADPQGTLIHTLGDALFLDQAQRVALRSGASWREEHRGTNAIGTALAEKQGVEIHGSEHFLQGHSFLTCAAAPILSGQGQLLGILDVSGDQRQGHPHTLGLVNTAACMIENQLLLDDSKRLLRLHLHAQPEGLGSVAEGIAVLSESGVIVGANRAALSLLQLHANELGRSHWSSVADVRLEALLAGALRGAPQTLTVRQRNGRLLFVRAQPGEAVTPRPAHVAPVQTVQPVQDALARLDTGDTQWRRAADKVRRVLNKSIPILIEGESGVGKELFARAIHDSSQRSAGPFVAINCAAIPENLIEAELFGYAAGAFTGARAQGSPGLLRQAHGGTLFLDEIGDMPLSMQGRLLRVLQERSVSPLGGGAAVAVDFALLCATHSQLRAASGLGQFRDDLLYRINGLTLRLPALRERTDFAALAAKLLAEFNPGAEVQLASEVLERLRAWHWPGNLRQLSSVLRTASAMLAEHETRVDWQHLPDDLVEDLRTSASVAVANTPVARAQDDSPAAAGAGATKADSGSLEQHARQMVRQALLASGGNVSQAARTLGISRQTLYKKMKPG
ncbi:MAG: sigma-54-dependent Fis family transcriptional regulator [Rhodoferax sp.]|nr:sigma-54-dependent Fis family transcriptional regulator [Rhodoferax sp.]